MQKWREEEEEEEEERRRRKVGGGVGEQERGTEEWGSWPRTNRGTAMHVPAQRAQHIQMDRKRGGWKMGREGKRRRVSENKGRVITDEEADKETGGGGGESCNMQRFL
ncbi:unnamed protein product [Pleuronectes platessa]|uniref:Uncharacterized protein n=1 Tax=Pleuronectes platessa TaxID=8262 RepID=A0A9N7YT55_PLEPL|nr:unnamed protein product [Pleuronectes platessa]